MYTLYWSPTGANMAADAALIEGSFRYCDGVRAERGPYLRGEHFSAADLFFYMLGF